MTFTNRKTATWALTIAICVITSCAGVKNIQPEQRLERSNCNQHVIAEYTKDDLPKPIHTLDLDTALTSRFSFESLNTANAIGILYDLMELVRQKKLYSTNSGDRKSIEFTELSQNINQRIAISSLEISAVSSKIDCEKRRADQMATYLKSKGTEEKVQITPGAIIVGGVGAVAVGILLGASTPEFTQIGVGVMEAMFDALATTNNSEEYFYHPRNPLKDIWTAPETSNIFPRPVWYYLTYQNPNTAEPSLRQQLINKWLGFGQIADIKEADKEVFYDLIFGAGGKYTADQLQNRANMHDQIEAYINVMKQDLKLLSLEIEKLHNE